jgi:tetratricopeptide (TPR) repeat protein
VPFAVLAAGLTALDLWLFYDLSASSDIALTLVQRIQIAGRAFWFYPLKLLWPDPLVALYPKWTVDTASVSAWLPLASAVAALGFLWRGRHRLGAGPWVAAACYTVTIAPALGLLKHGFMDFAWVADRFQYLASIGPLALIGAAMARLGASMARLDAGGFGKPAINMLVAAVLLALGAVTWRHAGLYVDHATLFRHNVEVYPESWQARCQLSTGLLKQGKREEAADELGRAVRLDPDERHGILLELALLQVSVGRMDEAEQSLQAALRARPDYPEGHYELARFRARQGRTDEAIDQYRQALRSRPDYVDALSGLDLLLRGQ